MISIYTEPDRAQAWLDRYRGLQPHFVCVLGFTETALIAGISAAGKEPSDRLLTAHADAEFLLNGVGSSVMFPLPTLMAGVSPTVISRAIVQSLQIPTFLIDAGLPQPLSVPAQTLSKTIARCVSTGQALPIAVVKDLFARGMAIGQDWSQQYPGQVLIVGECVVAGTTTALAVLMGLGIDAGGKVNSSHPTCNHGQKMAVVMQGLEKFKALERPDTEGFEQDRVFQLLAAVGDPMQPVAAGIAIGASVKSGVLLAGGTQMLAVYAIAQALVSAQNLTWNSDNVVVGTTRWVVEDQSGDTVGLAQAIGQVPLLATALNLGSSRYESLRRYEQGFVKEGVGAGGCAIAAALYQNWSNQMLVDAVEDLVQKIQ
jgi:uncharacterized protein (TIGR00303 family)